jgi:hypothetical protein
MARVLVLDSTLNRVFATDSLSAAEVIKNGGSARYSLVAFAVLSARRPGDCRIRRRSIWRCRRPNLGIQRGDRLRWRDPWLRPWKLTRS